MKRWHLSWLTGLVLLGSLGAASGDTIDDPLHGFCWGTTPACSDNGKNTPTNADPPNFGFWISPGDQTGNYLIDILVPDNAPDASGLSFTVTGNSGSLNGDSAINAAASLFDSTPWTTGDLAGPSGKYLGVAASPTNVIGAYLPSTQTLVSGTTGFYVYQADLGTFELPGASGSAGPELSLNATLPEGSYIVGFLLESTTTCTTKKGVTKCTTTSNNVATANSGAIFEDTPPPPGRVPEPASLALLAAGLLTLGGLLRSRHHA